MAGEAQAAFLSVGPSDVLSKFVGESEASIKQLFQDAVRRAERMESGCCVLFFDEIDALGMSRNDGRGGDGGGSGGGGKGENCAINGSGGGENSSRRILAELLIQLTNLSNGAGVGNEPRIDSSSGSCSNSKSHRENNRTHETNSRDGIALSDEYAHSQRKNNLNDNESPQQLHNHEFVHGGSKNDYPARRNPRPISPTSSEEECVNRSTTEPIMHTPREDSQSTLAPEERISASSRSTSVSESSCLSSPSQDSEMDGEESDSESEGPNPRIIVIAATNRPEDCDPALLRRFAIRVLVGLPCQRDRRKIIHRLLGNIEHTLTTEQLNDLALATEGWSGSDLESVAREAVMAPIRECLRSAAIRKMKLRKKREKYRGDCGMRKGENKTFGSGNNTGTPEGEENYSNENELKIARDELLNGFKSLRPVTLKDFEEAVSFWIGDGQEQMTAHMMTNNSSSSCHYDSDSSLEEMD